MFLVPRSSASCPLAKHREASREGDAALRDAAPAAGWYPTGDSASSGYKVALERKPNGKHLPAGARGGPPWEAAQAGLASVYSLQTI